MKRLFRSMTACSILFFLAALTMSAFTPPMGSCNLRFRYVGVSGAEIECVGTCDDGGACSADVDKVGGVYVYVCGCADGSGDACTGALFVDPGPPWEGWGACLFEDQPCGGGAFSCESVGHSGGAGFEFPCVCDPQ